jgi:hypothetical protein
MGIKKMQEPFFGPAFIFDPQVADNCVLLGTDRLNNNQIN